MRLFYWSNSKFANKIRGVEKPTALTGDGWDEWNKNAKNKHPIRYWFVEEFLDKLQDVVYWPIDTLYSVKYYLVNRFIDQSYALVAHKSNIKRGQWMDLPERILYCMFDELVDFVEIEKAYANFRWNDDESKDKKWWQVGKWRLRTYRNKDAGIDYLNWEMSLTNEEWAEDGEEIKPTDQAICAKEIYDLYNWYVNIRPNRPDVYDVTGWSAYCDDKRDRGIGFMNTDPEENKDDTKKMLAEITKLELQYEEEDTEMLIRLIKIRQSLWT